MVSHLPNQEQINAWPDFTEDAPMRILFSGCLAGIRCGYDGTSYGEHREMAELMALPNVEAISFCPEQYSFSTPRELCDIHGGNGFDVLDTKAQVLSESGQNWTQGMIRGAEEMLRLAQSKRAHLAILMDMSAACGSQVISDGTRLVPNRKYQRGPGVCAALLLRHGIPVISQRDYKTLGRIRAKLDLSYPSDPTARDHHETEWYLTYFGAS